MAEAPEETGSAAPKRLRKLKQYTSTVNGQEITTDAAHASTLDQNSRALLRSGMSVKDWNALYKSMIQRGVHKTYGDVSLMPAAGSGGSGPSPSPTTVDAAGNVTPDFSSQDPYAPDVTALAGKGGSVISAPPGTTILHNHGSEFTAGINHIIQLASAEGANKRVMLHHGAWLPSASDLHKKRDIRAVSTVHVDDLLNAINALGSSDSAGRNLAVMYHHTHPDGSPELHVVRGTRGIGVRSRSVSQGIENHGWSDVGRGFAAAPPAYQQRLKDTWSVIRSGEARSRSYAADRDPNSGYTTIPDGRAPVNDVGMVPGSAWGHVDYDQMLSDARERYGEAAADRWEQASRRIHPKIVDTLFQEIGPQEGDWEPGQRLGSEEDRQQALQNIDAALDYMRPGLGRDEFSRKEIAQQVPNVRAAQSMEDATSTWQQNTEAMDAAAADIGSAVRGKMSQEQSDRNFLPNAFRPGGGRRRTSEGLGMGDIEDSEKYYAKAEKDASKEVETTVPQEEDTSISTQGAGPVSEDVDQLPTEVQAALEQKKTVDDTDLEDYLADEEEGPSRRVRSVDPNSPQAVRQAGLTGRERYVPVTGSQAPPEAQKYVAAHMLHGVGHYALTGDVSHLYGAVSLSGHRPAINLAHMAKSQAKLKSSGEDSTDTQNILDRSVLDQVVENPHLDEMSDQQQGGMLGYAHRNGLISTEEHKMLTDMGSTLEADHARTKFLYGKAKEYLQSRPLSQAMDRAIGFDPRVSKHFDVPESAGQAVPGTNTPDFDKRAADLMGTMAHIIVPNQPFHMFRKYWGKHSAYQADDFGGEGRGWRDKRGDVTSYRTPKVINGSEGVEEGEQTATPPPLTSIRQFQQGNGAVSHGLNLVAGGQDQIIGDIADLESHDKRREAQEAAYAALPPEEREKAKPPMENARGPVSPYWETNGQAIAPVPSAIKAGIEVSRARLERDRATDMALRQAASGGVRDRAASADSGGVKTVYPPGGFQPLERIPGYHEAREEQARKIGKKQGVKYRSMTEEELEEHEAANTPQVISQVGGEDVVQHQFQPKPDLAEYPPGQGLPPEPDLDHPAMKNPVLQHHLTAIQDQIAGVVQASLGGQTAPSSEFSLRPVDTRALVAHGIQQARVARDMHTARIGMFQRKVRKGILREQREAARDAGVPFDVPREVITRAVNNATAMFGPNPPTPQEVHAHQETQVLQQALHREYGHEQTWYDSPRYPIARERAMQTPAHRITTETMHSALGVSTTPRVGRNGRGETVAAQDPMTVSDKSERYLSVLQSPSIREHAMGLVAKHGLELPLPPLPAHLQKLQTEEMAKSRQVSSGVPTPPRTAAVQAAYTPAPSEVRTMPGMDRSFTLPIEEGPARAPGTPTTFRGPPTQQQLAGNVDTVIRTIAQSTIPEFRAANRSPELTSGEREQIGDTPMNMSQFKPHLTAGIRGVFHPATPEHQEQMSGSMTEPQIRSMLNELHVRKGVPL